MLVFKVTIHFIVDTKQVLVFICQGTGIMVCFGGANLVDGAQYCNQVWYIQLEKITGLGHWDIKL